MRELKLQIWFTPQDLADITGLTAAFIRGELHSGALVGHYIRPDGRKRGRWMIHVTNAKPYLQRLGYTQYMQGMQRTT